MVQMNAQNGVLLKPEKSDMGESDYKLQMVELFKAGKILEARKLICSTVRPEEMEDVFRWMYDNLDLWAKDVHKQDQAIVIIRNGYVNIPLVADQEINLSATLVELSGLK
jgi:hypothetical protein